MANENLSLQSQTIDYFLALGIAVHSLTRGLMERRDLEVRLGNGRLELAYRGEEQAARSGYAGVELTVDDWQRILSKIGGLPEKVGSV